MSTSLQNRLAAALAGAIENTPVAQQQSDFYLHCKALIDEHTRGNTSPKLVISVQGGLVSHVVGDQPVEVTVLDYDSNGASEDLDAIEDDPEVHAIPQPGGFTKNCYAETYDAIVEPIEVARIHSLISPQADASQDLGVKASNPAIAGLGARAPSSESSLRVSGQTIIVLSDGGTWETFDPSSVRVVKVTEDAFQDLCEGSEPHQIQNDQIIEERRLASLLDAGEHERMEAAFDYGQLDRAREVCEQTGISLEMATEAEIYGRWDWTDNDGNASEMSFATEQGAISDALMRRYGDDWAMQSGIGLLDFVEQQLANEQGMRP